MSWFIGIAQRWQGSQAGSKTVSQKLMGWYRVADYSRCYATLRDQESALGYFGASSQSSSKLSS